MKTSFVALPLFLTSAVALANPSPRGPDFSPSPPRYNVDPLVAASSGTLPILPTDIIAFRLGSDVISPAALTQITIAVEWLEQHKNQVLVVEGHTDQLGPWAFNEDLAARRADAVRTQLVLRGVPSDRIVLEVFGAVGAVGRINPLERTAVISTTRASIPRVVDNALDERGALSVQWTNKGTAFSETSSGHVDHATLVGRL